jgi:streptomycin 6-kinase
MRYPAFASAATDRMYQPEEAPRCDTPPSLRPPQTAWTSLRRQRDCDTSAFASASANRMNQPEEAK